MFRTIGEDPFCAGDRGSSGVAAFANEGGEDVAMDSWKGLFVNSVTRGDIISSSETDVFCKTGSRKGFVDLGFSSSTTFRIPECSLNDGSIVAKVPSRGDVKPNVLSVDGGWIDAMANSVDRGERSTFSGVSEKCIPSKVRPSLRDEACGTLLTL